MQIDDDIVHDLALVAFRVIDYLKNPNYIMYDDKDLGAQKALDKYTKFYKEKRGQQRSD